MHGQAIQFVEYLEGHSKRFVIPVYQRNYSWKIENCRQLYDDLVKLINNKREMHFFGSIVSVNSGKFQEYLIIDGQQRVTTISLILLAIRNVLKDGKLKAENNDLSDLVYETYLANKFGDKSKRIKLKGSYDDYKAFEKLFDNDSSEYIQNSDITINYQYFYDRILKEEIFVDDLYKAICSLVVINITVDEKDDPQLIFESLNSTGVDLTEGDKIRNYVLMGQKKETQEIFYEKYWQKIETCTCNDKNDNNGVSLFVRDYLSVKMQATPSMDKIYPVFKEFVSNAHFSVEELLVDLLYYAKIYEKLIKSQFADDVIRESISRLNYLETTVSRPFFMQVLHLYQEKDSPLSLDALREIFQIIENYLFRRNICDVPTNALNKIFLMLDRDIQRFDRTYDNYLEKMKFVLLSKKESGRFPTDKEFETALSEKQVYLMRSRFKNYLFERYENFGTLEVKKIYDGLENDIYSIEHIMPQTLTPAWKNSLGDNYNEIYETWIHRLANLTLTAYNREYSNRPFLEKRDATFEKDGYNGFKESGLRMNQSISQNDKWTEDELINRDLLMKRKALEIWRFPQTSCKPIEKQFDTVTLDEDFRFTGVQLAKFAYKNTEYNVSSWTEMYAKMLSMLHSEDNSVLTKLAYTSDQNVDLSIHVSNNPNEFSVSAQIAPNIYVWTRTDTQYKINCLRKFFHLFNANPEDLLFYLKSQDNDDNSDNIPERYELRKKYWAFALSYIQKHHENKVV